MFSTAAIETSCPLRQKIRQYYHSSEEAVMREILSNLSITNTHKTRAWERARALVVNIRDTQAGQGGIDALLNEFSLSSEEGVVLMCLAEALLRVPDEETQDNLIRDKLSRGDWATHLGNSESMFVNASSWGLLITGKMVTYTDEEKKAQLGVLKKTIGRLGEPVIRASVQYAMKIMGKQFVMGRSINEALERAVATEELGYSYSYDMLGEGARTMADAERYFDSYMSAIHDIGLRANGRGPIKSPGISVKLSAIHPRYEYLKKQRVIDELVPKVLELALAAKSYNIGFTIDAEEADRLDLSLDVIEAVFTDPALGNWTGFGVAVQSYLKRAPYVIDWLYDLAQNANRKMMLRLVKGAYWDSEIKHSQKMGLEGYPIFTRKPSTDVCYLACAEKLMQYRDYIFPQFATHNAYTAALVLQLCGEEKDNFEFQRLHGMGDSLYDQIVSEDKVQCRIYAPVGEHQDLLAYLVRRLLENGANSSFVNAIVDESQSIESLLADPIEKVQQYTQFHHPRIPMPIELYGDERPNSAGMELADPVVLKPALEDMAVWFSNNVMSYDDLPEQAIPMNNPANHKELLGYIHHHDDEGMKLLVDKAAETFQTWSKISVDDRAEKLNKLADLLEEHMHELIGLCIKEAGKVIQDGVDEVREAVDFCRYYSARAQELAEDTRLESRGVVLCISPWNFPLAIFLGQVSAAMVAGNTVIAKPAEQTSLIALRTIELMKEAGIPDGVVQPVLARGSQVGRVLLPDERIAAVMFTGSTETGNRIARTLAERGGDQVPLIAETGGQNCLIVDSTALPEQVVDDVISSGFQSAGQRCSALRVVFIQDDVADRIVEMIIGAMKELRVSDPAWVDTDVGPAIDQAALQPLLDHVEYMKDKGKLLHQCELDDVDHDEHTFFPPHLYEIDNISVLKEEVFGPIVHVIRYKASEIEEVINEINGTGFGLTMGIHSRIEGRADKLAALSGAGNVYINRNMIGAIVGVQPFGGRGLSGTGPKAGGPDYVKRLMKEKVSLENTQSTEAIPSEVSFRTSDETRQTIKTMVTVDGVDWTMKNLDERTIVIRQWLAKLASVSLLQEFADDLEDTLYQARLQLLTIEKYLGHPVELPGPTGESNKLYHEPRGLIVCYADKDTSFNFWVLSIVTALATGNRVITVVSEFFYQEAVALVQELDEEFRSILQVARLDYLKLLLTVDEVDGVVVGNGCQRKSFINQELAKRDGKLVPMISCEYEDNLIERLVMEKTVSIDTTASGGNTLLMTLGDIE